MKNRIAKNLIILALVLCLLVCFTSCSNAATVTIRQVRYISTDSGWQLFDDKELSVVENTTVTAEAPRGYELVEGEGTPTVTAKEGAVITAYFTEKLLTVKFSAETDEGLVVKEAKALYNQAVTPPSWTPRLEGYEFLGWTSGGRFDFSTPITKDITLSADWDVAKVETDNTDYATKYFSKHGESETILTLELDGSALLSRDGVNLTRGSYVAKTDGYMTLTFEQGEYRGEYKARTDNLTFTIIGFENGEDEAFSKYGYLLFDFDDESQMDAVTDIVKYYHTTTNGETSWVKPWTSIDFRNSDLVEKATGSFWNSTGCVFCNFGLRGPIDGDPNQFYRGGFTVELPEKMEAENLVVVYGAYMVDQLNNRNEVICAGSCDRLGRPYDDWYKTGNPPKDWWWFSDDEQANYCGRFRTHTIENSAGEFYVGEEGTPDYGYIYSLWFLSFRDDPFFLDFICYYYE